MPEKVIIDQDECIGCEACVEICPAVFSFDDGVGKA
jgi:ferredoxin